MATIKVRIDPIVVTSNGIGIEMVLKNEMIADFLRLALERYNELIKAYPAPAPFRLTFEDFARLVELNHSCETCDFAARMLRKVHEGLKETIIELAGDGGMIDTGPEMDEALDEYRRFTAEAEQPEAPSVKSNMH
jgi:hypothetical protein